MIAWLERSVDRDAVSASARYDVEAAPIRSRSDYRLLAATRGSGRRPCVVLVPGPDAPFDEIARAFAEIDRVHGLLDHPSVPAVAARGACGGVPFLELTCDAVADGIEVRRLLTRSGDRIPLSYAVGFLHEVLCALRSAHAVLDPATGRPVCLGRISCENLLFSPAGRVYLVGFGRNFPVEAACGEPDGSVTTFEAPEVAAGGDASPSGDQIALLLLMRSLLKLVDLGPALRALSGGDSPASAAWIERLRWVDMSLLGFAGGPRRGAPAADETRDRLRAICGVEPDPEGFARYIRALLHRRQALSPAAVHRLPGLVVGLEASWVSGPDGVCHPLGQALRRIVMALIARYQGAPGAVLTTEELIEAGWPGERPGRRSGANRVYVALTQLRKTGLKDVLERRDGGYRIRPSAAVRLSP